jgi:hypothetical protein
MVIAFPDICEAFSYFSTGISKVIKRPDNGYNLVVKPGIKDKCNEGHQTLEEADLMLLKKRTKFMRIY